MGDHSLLACRVDGGTTIVKADKSFNRPDGAAIGVDFSDAVVHLFHKAGIGRADRVNSRHPAFDADGPGQPWPAIAPHLAFLGGLARDPAQPIELWSEFGNVDVEHFSDDAGAAQAPRTTPSNRPTCSSTLRRKRGYRESSACGSDRPRDQ
jgi:hypothetical protein